MLICSPLSPAPRRLLLHSIGIGQRTHILLAATLHPEDRLQVHVPNGQILQSAEQRSRDGMRILVTLSYNGAAMPQVTTLSVQNRVCASLIPLLEQHPLLLVDQQQCADLQLSIFYQVWDPFSEQGGGGRWP